MDGYEVYMRFCVHIRRVGMHVLVWLYSKHIILYIYSTLMDNFVYLRSFFLLSLFDAHFVCAAAAAAHSSIL